MTDMIRCPVCGAPNPNTLERCRACNQLLEQSTKELGGFGERINSGVAPTPQKTSELEKTLPAWLRRARQTDQDDLEETPSQADGEPVDDPEPEDDAPIFPDFSAEDAAEEEDVDPVDWLAGLSESAEDEDDEAESADWLMNLQGDLAPEKPEPEAARDQSPRDIDDEVTEEANLPNWMDTLQEDADDSLPDLIPQTEPKADFENLPGEDGVPDWLSRLSDESERNAETLAVSPDSAPSPDAQPTDLQPEDSLPDWMANLQSVGEISDNFPPIETSSSVPVESPAEEPADELPDWMDSLQAAVAIPTETEPEPVASLAPADDLPEWLAGDTPAETTDALPDWMSSLQGVGESPAPQAEEPAASSAVDDDLPDWLSGEGAADSPAPVAAGSDDLPDWLGGTAENTSPADESPDDLPDWLGGDDLAVEAAPAEMSSDLPDWISSLPSVGESVAETESVAPIEKDEMPDWLGAEKPANAESALAGDDLPDWISGIQADADPSAEEESPEWLKGGEEEADEIETAPAFEGVSPAELADDLPDWMADLQTAAETMDVSLQDEPSITESSAQEGASPFGDAEIPLAEGDIPDWLSRIGKPTTSSLEGNDLGDEALVPALQAADEAPEWLDALPGIDDFNSPAQDERKEKSPASSGASAFVDDSAVVSDDDDDEIFGIDMPDWLSNLAPEDLGIGEEVTPVTAAGDGDLSGAELPSWVQAMRPVESVVEIAPVGEEQVLVESGPLAGLSGILPVGAGVGPKSKPQAHSLKLRVNESQQSGALLLERILASESEAAARESEDSPKSIPLLRWLIAGLMLIVVIAALLMPQEIAPPPQFAAPETSDTVTIIQGLPAEGTVLVIFDYEAALSAELQAAAAPVVDHIMLRGQKLALLSSTPNGSALAERLIQATQSAHAYQAGADYVNLGYLSGGAAGMLNFVTSPRTAMIGQLDGISFWEQPPLMNIHQLTDFSAVLILTDDVEKGRAWIEQGSATLNTASVPLLMVVSAQAEPIIYPYYASTQVDGLVSGLNGGATYERLQGKSGLGHEYWNAYSMGLFAAEILIVVGAVLNFLAGLRARQKEVKEEE